ncbi:MAG: hypothetical protein AABN95_25350 [Acidobacteriota bacterium]
MKYLLMAMLALSCLSTANSQQDLSPEAQPFYISSLNTGFGVRGLFEGEYRIYPDRIKLKVTKAEIRVSRDCPYQGRRQISALRFDLAKSLGDKRWDSIKSGQDFFIDEVMNPGDSISFHDLYFDILIDDSIDLPKHWLLVRIEDTALDVPPECLQKGYAFAHSSCDIFSHAGYEASLRKKKK